MNLGVSTVAAGPAVHASPWVRQPELRLRMWGPAGLAHAIGVLCAFCKVRGLDLLGDLQGRLGEPGALAKSGVRTWQTPRL